MHPANIERPSMPPMKAVVSDNAPAAIGPYSQGIAVNGVVYTSGVIPLDPATKEIAGDDISAQAERVLKSLTALLEDAGSSMDMVIKTTCFLQDLNDFATFNEIYGRYFTGDTPPARSTVQVAKLPMGVLVEIEAVALQK
jgi:2-iminobutanoate/2-iminopropanoate deaminase